jgi:hypothetical protein
MTPTGRAIALTCRAAAHQISAPTSPLQGEGCNYPRFIPARQTSLTLHPTSSF